MWNKVDETSRNDVFSVVSHNTWYTADVTREGKVTLGSGYYLNNGSENWSDYRVISTISCESILELQSMINKLIQVSNEYFNKPSPPELLDSSKILIAIQRDLNNLLLILASADDTRESYYTALQDIKSGIAQISSKISDTLNEGR
jgi:hypothetical protein